MSVIDELQAADQRLVALYMPYYRDTKRTILPRAISLYQKRNLEGMRKIEGGENIPFVATWSVSAIPSDQTLCRMQFDNKGEQLGYEVRMENYVFIDFLIDVIVSFKRYQHIDFSKGFYRKLLRIDE